jgi:hypothetical protein
MVERAGGCKLTCSPTARETSFTSSSKSRQGGAGRIRQREGLCQGVATGGGIAARQRLCWVIGWAGERSKWKVAADHVPQRGSRAPMEHDAKLSLRPIASLRSWKGDDEEKGKTRFWGKNLKLMA